MPAWIEVALSDRNRAYPTVADRMALVIDLARKNIVPRPV
jgi:hypothetical protein